MSDIYYRNGVPEEDLLEAGIEYLVCAEFSAGEGDGKKKDATRWVALEDLKSVGDEALDAALDAFEAQNVRLRRAARQAPAA